MTQYLACFTNSSGSVLTGDTTSAQWFAIGDPAFSITQTLTFPLGSTDITPGKASFNGLSLTLGSSSLTGKIEKASQHLAYDAAKGTLYYDDDGTGAHAAVLIATLAGAPALALADFALVA